MVYDPDQFFDARLWNLALRMGREQQTILWFLPAANSCAFSKKSGLCYITFYICNNISSSTTDYLKPVSTQSAQLISPSVGQTILNHAGTHFLPITTLPGRGKHLDRTWNEPESSWAASDHLSCNIVAHRNNSKRYVLNVNLLPELLFQSGDLLRVRAHLVLVVVLFRASNRTEDSRLAFGRARLERTLAHLDARSLSAVSKCGLRAKVIS